MPSPLPERSAASRTGADRKSPTRESSSQKPRHRLRTLLVANRGEVAGRILRAARESGLATVAVVTPGDPARAHLALADRVEVLEGGVRPGDGYLDGARIVQAALAAGADAIHPGYGYLAESGDFARAVIAAGLRFVGPDPGVLDLLGDKVAARRAARTAGVPVLPASLPLSLDPTEAREEARRVGYPLVVKACWGGGGRGMRVVENESDLERAVAAARAEAGASFPSDEVYLERLVARARHLEVQVLADAHGHAIHLFERDCSVQRRHQKIIEQAPAPGLDADTRARLHDHALRLARSVGLTQAATFEFLLDADDAAIWFIEANPRLQVEHTITEAITGVDIVRAQLAIADGARIGDRDAGLPAQDDIRINGHAIQCRVNAESPDASFAPASGVVSACALPGGPGVRVDAVALGPGTVVGTGFDSLLAKIVTHGETAATALARMRRALDETRIEGLPTNLPFLRSALSRPALGRGDWLTRGLELDAAAAEAPAFAPREERALAYLAEVSALGHPELRGRPIPARPFPTPRVPSLELDVALSEHDAAPSGLGGLRARLQSEGAQALSRWIRSSERLLVTDTAFREAQQSLLATRVRTVDLEAIAPAYARLMPGLFSVETWGGATFDVALRYLHEDPWDRLRRLRAAMPDHLMQMMLRGVHGVGYTTQTPATIRRFVRRAFEEGIDVFRIFDAMNLVPHIRVAMDAVLETGAFCEPTICYTGDLFDPARPKWNLDYYVGLAREFERAGAHAIGIKDMAGVCKPRAAAALVRAIREATTLPVHLNVHDTSGIGAATVLAAVDAGVDAVDCAMDALSGLTSQPILGSIAAALSGTPRDPGFDPRAVQAISRYWEGVRALYAPYEADSRAGTSEVYRHEMPGGQYTNLREQARRLGLAERWDEIARTYAEVNHLFGDLVKITPTSKIVADMALWLVSNGLTTRDVLESDRPMRVPESVVSLLRGDLGVPTGGFPEAVVRRLLGDASLREAAANDAVPVASAAVVTPIAMNDAAAENEALSALMFPAECAALAEHRARFGDVSRLPTAAFLYGLLPGEEVRWTTSTGAPVTVRLVAMHAHADGHTTVVLECNGEMSLHRVARPEPAATSSREKKRVDVDPNDAVLAPMAGLVVSIAVREGADVKQDELVAVVEAMKMQIEVVAPRDGRVANIHVRPGDDVAVRDVLMTLE